jgi:hypothetical protein
MQRSIWEVVVIQTACGANTRYGLAFGVFMWVVCYVVQRWGPRPGVASREVHPPRWVAFLCGFPRRDEKVEVGFCGFQLASLLFVVPILLGCGLGMAPVLMIQLGKALVVVGIAVTVVVGFVLEAKELRAEERFWKEVELKVRKREHEASGTVPLDHPPEPEGHKKRKRTKHG